MRPNPTKFNSCRVGYSVSGQTSTVKIHNMNTTLDLFAVFFFYSAHSVKMPRWRSSEDACERWVGHSKCIGAGLGDRSLECHWSECGG